LSAVTERPAVRVPLAPSGFVILISLGPIGADGATERLILIVPGSTNIVELTVRPVAGENDTAAPCAKSLPEIVSCMFSPCPTDAGSTLVIEGGGAAAVIGWNITTVDALAPELADVALTV
jgi:hypothetical protein